jgi:hypothetical protein
MEGKGWIGLKGAKSWLLIGSQKAGTVQVYC